MDITERIDKRFKRLGRQIESLLTKYQVAYLSAVVLIAISGYLLVLLFPLLSLMLGYSLVNHLIHEPVINWPMITAGFCVFLISSLLSYSLFRAKPAKPVGLNMSEKVFPEVFKLVEKMNGYFKYPRISKIIMTNHYELDIIKTPLSIFPVWSTNTLVIGLPLLLCVSPQQFECLMARRIGQFSKKHNIVTNWLYQLRASWKLFCNSYAQQKQLDSRFINWLLMVYSSLYSIASVYVVRKEELNADNYGMEVYNHKYMYEMMMADAVYRHYLENTFWPAAQKVALQNVKPNRNLLSVVNNVIKGEKLEVLAKKVFAEVPEWNHPYPSLKQRLEEIAYHEVSMTDPDEVKAANQFIGSSLNNVIDLMDKLWLRSALKERQRDGLEVA